VWKNIESEMQCNKPFNIMETIKNSPEGPKLFSPVPQANIPSNLQPQLMQQVFNNIMAQASQLIQVNPIDYELILSTVESIYGKSVYILEGKIVAARLPNMQFQISNTITSNCWKYSSNEKRRMTPMSPLMYSSRNEDSLLQSLGPHRLTITARDIKNFKPEAMVVSIPRILGYLRLMGRSLRE